MILRIKWYLITFFFFIIVWKLDSANISPNIPSVWRQAHHDVCIFPPVQQWAGKCVNINLTCTDFSIREAIVTRWLNSLVVNVLITCATMYLFPLQYFFLVHGFKYPLTTLILAKFSFLLLHSRKYTCTCTLAIHSPALQWTPKAYRFSGALIGKIQLWDVLKHKYK